MVIRTAYFFSSSFSSSFKVIRLINKENEKENSRLKNYDNHDANKILFYFSLSLNKTKNRLKNMNDEEIKNIYLNICF